MLWLHVWGAGDPSRALLSCVERGHEPFLPAVSGMAADADLHTAESFASSAAWLVRSDARTFGWTASRMCASCCSGRHHRPQPRQLLLLLRARGISPPARAAEKAMSAVSHQRVGQGPDDPAVLDRLAQLQIVLHQGNAHASEAADGDTAACGGGGGLGEAFLHQETLTLYKLYKP